jgi:hypothetical protein
MGRPGRIGPVGGSFSTIQAPAWTFFPDFEVEVEVGVALAAALSVVVALVAALALVVAAALSVVTATVASVVGVADGVAAVPPFPPEQANIGATSEGKPRAAR